MNASRWIVLTALVVGSAACGGNNTTDGGGNSDANDALLMDGSDAGGDVVSESVADTGSDAGADGARDAVVDTGVDAIVDAGADVGADTGTDTGTDVAIDTAMDVGVDVTDSNVTDTNITDTGPGLPFGSPCNATSTCAAPTGEVGTCAGAFPQPVCLSSCDQSPDFALCEGGAGVCVPIGAGHKVCAPKCGDIDHLDCAAGSACLFLGYRDHTGTDAGYQPVGACLPACSATGTAACTTVGTACDTGTGSCSAIGCPMGCPTGSSCSVSSCVPNTPIPLYGACTPTAAGASNGCQGQHCVATATGYCSAPCNTSNEASVCGNNGVCWANIAYGSITGDGGTISFPLPQFVPLGGNVDGLCVKTCTDSSDCPGGFVCSEYNGKRVCIITNVMRSPNPNPGNSSVQVGGVCHADADCASNHCTRTMGYYDGLCALASTGLTCPPGTTIATDGVTCLPDCTGTRYEECTDSLVCNGSIGECVPGLCRDNADCSDGYSCNHDSSRCELTPPGGNPLGAPCTAMTDCAGEICVTTTSDGGVTWPNGYCTSLCTVLPDFSDTCPANGICTASTAGSLGACVALCDAGSVVRFGPCRAGYTCTALSAGSAVGACVP